MFELYEGLKVGSEWLVSRFKHLHYINLDPVNIAKRLTMIIKTLLVTGGEYYGSYISSTEILRDLEDAQSTWSLAASLASPRSWFSVATIDNTVFVLGNYPSIIWTPNFI